MHRKLTDISLVNPDNFVTIGDTMEPAIRGAFDSGMQSYLVISGSTQFEDVADYV